MYYMTAIVTRNKSKTSSTSSHKINLLKLYRTNKVVLNYLVLHGSQGKYSSRSKIGPSWLTDRVIRTTTTRNLITISNVVLKTGLGLKTIF